MSIDVNIADIREGYEREGLVKNEMHSNLIAQFNNWMQEAIDAQLNQPNTCTLATATREGRPSARIVLLKDAIHEGFIFYTNYEGRKGKELIENPFASMVFLWPSLSRQVRVNGTVEKVDKAISDAYFASRPEGSQLSAWASPQSQVVENRLVLEKNLAACKERFKGGEIPRPPHWGGFCLKPEKVEFWQGRPSRLHDRLRYIQQGSQWDIERLAP